MNFDLKKFFKENKWAILLGIGVYTMFLFFTISGNRICDCVSTEKTSSGTRSHTSVNRFYHK